MHVFDACKTKVFRAQFSLESFKTYFRPGQNVKEDPFKFSRKVPWQTPEYWAPLLPLLAGRLAQVRGLGLVQRQELLQGEVHGPRVVRDSARVPDVQGSHGAG